MSLVLQSSGGGQITIQEPTTASNFTQTLPAATGTVALLQTPSFATTIAVGGATPSTSGAGITFPATQSASTDANTLDDYEEGTWTPVDGSGAGLSFTAAVGRYVKIGNTVFVNMFVEYPTNSNGVAAYVAGLPFSSSNSDTNYVGSVGLNDTAKANFYPFVDKGTTGIFLRNENNSNFFNTNMSGKTFAFTAQYTVA